MGRNGIAMQSFVIWVQHIHAQSWSTATSVHESTTASTTQLPSHTYHTQQQTDFSIILAITGIVTLL